MKMNDAGNVFQEIGWMMDGHQLILMTLLSLSSLHIYTVSVFRNTNLQQYESWDALCSTHTDNGITFEVHQTGL